MSTETKKKSERTEVVTGKQTPQTHEGKLVSIASSKLAMTNTKGEELTLSIAKDAKLNCDGETCKSSDMKPGTRIRVTICNDDSTVVRSVEAIDKTSKFAECC